VRSLRHDAESFLAGDPRQVNDVRSAIEFVVRAFQFHDADANRELVQETMARVFLSLCAGRFRGDSSLKTYAGNVAKYTCLEHRRRRRVETGADFDRLAPDGSSADPEAILLREEEHERNLRAFATLSPDCRELLRLIFVEGLSYDEVATRLGVSEGAIKSRVHRCRLGGRGYAASDAGDAGQSRQSRKVRP
jgi:RNA polymerase sigma-70 factor (ECF subfamily)